MLSESKYLRQGFDHYNASSVKKNLKDNNFFSVQHYINLYDEKLESHLPVKKEEDLERIIKEEMDTILSSPELSKKWKEIDKKLSANNDLRSLRDYIFENKETILPKLENLEKFAQEIWISYFIDQKSLYENLLEKYKNGKIEIEKIITKAKRQTTDWKRAIKIFKERFFVPFELEIGNQEDVILKEKSPIIKFIFVDKDSDETRIVEKDNLWDALSSGERRAWYILNVIFEVQARKKEKKETLFIIDDIADSFDYKNKYAIIEYLKEISEENNFYQIILTHNFDFFRTIQSRLHISRGGNCLMVEKTKDGVRFVDAEYLNPPFKWMQHLDEDKKLVASIPFTRNIIEYISGVDDQNYKDLTSVLHIKSNSETITKKSIEGIYRKIFSSQSTLSLKKPTIKIVDLIFSLADACLGDPEGINLENKILLAIAIRLKAEKFMRSKITKKSEADANQTREFFERFKDEFDDEATEKLNIKILEKVILMTPENIHFNSFMYEPILDMSDQYLRGLYEDVKKLT